MTITEILSFICTGLFVNLFLQLVGMYFFLLTQIIGLAMGWTWVIRDGGFLDEYEQYLREMTFTQSIVFTQTATIQTLRLWIKYQRTKPIDNPRR
jgi:hypothetical protein